MLILNSQLGFFGESENHTYTQSSAFMGRGTKQPGVQSSRMKISMKRNRCNTGVWGKISTFKNKHSECRDQRRRQPAPAFNSTHRKRTASSSMMTCFLLHSVGVSPKTRSGWTEQEINQLGNICAAVRRAWVGDSFPHTARDGDFSLALLQDVEPSPDG